jgi:glycerophosphoryl diester phosphodiesterase
MAYIIAHRANGSKYKENTKEAALEVLSYPYVDGIELDVQMTKDNKFVLSHNSFLLCKNKQIKNIHEMNYKELMNCKPIPLLEDVLNAIKGGKIILLDLKVDMRKKAFQKYFLKLISKYQLLFYIASFDYEFVKKLKRKNPKLKLGYIKGPVLNLEKKKDILDFCLVYYKQYHKEEGVWTINTKEEFQKFTKKPIFLITNHPEFNK